VFIIRCIHIYSSIFRAEAQVSSLLIASAIIFFYLVGEGAAVSKIWNKLDLSAMLEIFTFGASRSYHF